MRLIPASAYERVAWNNGGGVTDDIDVVHDRDRVVWRVSLATIARDGRFSDLRGYDRTIVPLAGAGIELTFVGEPPVVLARAFAAYRFDGGAIAVCRLLGAPLRALNVMTLCEAFDHHVALLELEGGDEPIEGCSRECGAVYYPLVA